MNVASETPHQADSYGPPPFGGRLSETGSIQLDFLSRLKWKRKTQSPRIGEQPPEIETERGVVHGYPLERYRAQLVNLIREHAVTIVSAPTGTGKSTLLPLFLLEEVFRVVSTNPRRAPCEENGRCVALLHDSEIGDCIGFRHGKAKELSKDAQVIFATEAYEFRRLLHDRVPISKPTVYILDELHENTEEGHAILALLRERMERGELTKLVITSATIDREPFCGSFDDSGITPAFFEIPDTQKPITDAAKGLSLIDDIMRGDKNTLVFVPGKRQIQQILAELDERAPAHFTVFGLHGEMSRLEQREALNYRPQAGEVKIIVATKIAQSSLTPLDMERVICTGFDRFEETDHVGIRNLVMRPDTQAMVAQKRGRVDRQAPGEFIHHGPIPSERLPQRDTPQMQNQPVDGMILDVTAAGRDFDRFNTGLLYPAPAHNIELGKKSLYSNNLIGPQGHVTHLGRAVANLPLSVHAGIVVAKAQAIATQQGLKPSELLLHAVGIAAVMEAKGILSREARTSGDKRSDWRPSYSSTAWKKHCRGEIDSDVVAQMQVLEALLDVSDERLEKCGIHVNHFNLARDTRRDVCERLGIDPKEKAEPLSESIRGLLMESVYAQYDRWWRVVSSRKNSDRLSVKPVVGSGDAREVAAGSLVSDKATFVIGEPINIDNEPFDLNPSKLLVMVSPLPESWIRAHTPPAQVKNDIEDALGKAIHTEPEHRVAHRPSYARRSSFGRGR